MDVKRCGRCKFTKSASEFRRNKSTKSGLDCYCKACRLECQREQIARNPEAWRATQNRWIVKNRQRIREYSRQFRARHLEKEKARIRKILQKRRSEKPHLVIAARKRYSQKHPDRVFARKKCWYAVKTGKLPRPNSLACIKCSEPATQYHHHNGYTKEHWYDVVPVCRLCHEAIEHEKLT